MPRIYFPELTDRQRQIELSAKQAQHIRVLRLNTHDPVELFNGKGLNAEARLTLVNKKTVAAEILAYFQVPTPRTFPIRLAMSLIRNEPMDWVMQKSVELGVHEIVPIIAERSQGRFNAEQAEKKQTHWFEIMVSACEQSGLNFLPRLHPLCTFSDFIHQDADSGYKLLLDPYASLNLKSLKKHITHSGTLLIGPEGGFTEPEITTAKLAGFMPISLHEQILRAETAAISAVAITQFYFS